MSNLTVFFLASSSRQARHPHHGLMRSPDDPLLLPPHHGLLRPPGDPLLLPPHHGLLRPPGYPLLLPPHHGLLWPPCDPLLSPLHGLVHSLLRPPHHPHDHLAHMYIFNLVIKISDIIIRKSRVTTSLISFQFRKNLNQFILVGILLFRNFYRLDLIIILIEIFSYKDNI